MKGNNDKASRKIAGLIGGSLVLGALAAMPQVSSATTLGVNYLGSGAQLRTKLVDLNQFGEAAKKDGAKEDKCMCPGDKTEEGKCGEGKCGGEPGTKNCKCPDKGADKAAAGKGASDTKKADSSKAATGGKSATKHAADKTEEGKCGEGKCGE